MCQLNIAEYWQDSDHNDAVLQTADMFCDMIEPLLVISECITFQAVEERLDNGLEGCKTQMVSIKVLSLNDKYNVTRILFPHKL